MSRYFIVSQCDDCGHEHRWVFDEKEYSDVQERFCTDGEGTPMLYPGETSEVTVVESDNMDSVRKLVRGCLLDRETVEYNSSDPSPKDLAEYYCTIETDFGCAGRFVTEKQVDAFNESAKDTRYFDLVNLGLKDFYNDSLEGFFYSDIVPILQNRERAERLRRILDGHPLYPDDSIGALTFEYFKDSRVIGSASEIAGYENSHVSHALYGVSLDEFLEKVYASDYGYAEAPFYIYEKDYNGLKAVYFDTKYDSAYFYTKLFKNVPLLVRSEWDYLYFDVYNIDGKNVHSRMDYSLNPDSIGEKEPAYEADISITLDIDGHRVTEGMGDGYSSMGNLECVMGKCNEVHFVKDIYERDREELDR